MKAAVGGVAVFGGAGRAHCEAGHGCLRPVIGHAIQDGEAGAAMGAVGEGIAASTPAAADFRQAIGAGCGIGGHACCNAAATAGGDHEAVGQRACKRGNVHAINPGEAGRAGDDAGDEGGKPVAGRFDGDPAGIVPDPTAQAMFLGQTPDEGAEAHALNLTTDTDCQGFWQIIRHGWVSVSHMRTNIKPNEIILLTS